ncbi:MAG: hypothetical protein AAFZ18_04905 [Myxococcota bacterium]
MKRVSLLSISLLVGPWACGTDLNSAMSELRAGPEVGGTVPTGTCGELEALCDVDCSGDFENTTCRGVLTGGSYDNVEVPEGETCVLDGALVTGNLIIKKGASLAVGTGSFVCGNLQAEEASRVQGQDLRVCGNLQASKTDRVELGSLVEVRQNLDASETQQLVLTATLVCADAQLSEVDRVEVSSGSASVVAKDCSADEIGAFDFTGLEVNGDNDGCLGTR